MKKLTVTVAICSRNRPLHLKNLLRQVKSQTVKPDHLILVENISETQSFSQKKLESFFSKSNVSVQYLKTTGRNVAISRNKVLKHVSTDLLISLDDDILIENNFCEKMLSAHKKRPEVFGIVCPVLPLKNDRFSRFTSELYNGIPGKNVKESSVDFFGFSAICLQNSILRKEALFFDETLDTAEDVFFLRSFTKKNYQLIFVPTFTVKSDFLSDGLQSFFQRYISYAKFLPIIHKKNPQFFVEAIDYVPKKRWYWLIFPLYFFAKPLHQSLYLEKKIGLSPGLLLPNYLFHFTYMVTIFFSKHGFQMFQKKFSADFLQ